MNLIWTDPHITEDYIEEINIIADEIIASATGRKIEKVIMIGDYYDKERPTSIEILFGTELALRFAKAFKEVVFVRGNHDKSRGASAIDYLKYFGIEIVDDYIDQYNNFYGHFMTNKSLYDYGSYQMKVSELKQYNYVLLGHQHSWQSLDDRMWHLGSVRFCHFNEVTDDFKKIAFVNKEQIEFVNLKTPTPMIDIKTSEGDIIKKLEGTNATTKVRVVLEDYDSFKSLVSVLPQYEKKFIVFKVKHDYQKTDIVAEPVSSVEKKDKKNSLQLAVNQIKDPEVKTILLEQFKEEGLCLES